MAVQDSPSAVSPRPSDVQGPATLPVRRLGRYVESPPFHDRPTSEQPFAKTPHTPSPRVPPTSGTEYPSIEGYEIVRQLGRGGMGVVYLAKEKALNRWVALKVVVGGVFAGSEAAERFAREAEAVAALQHPNIIQIFNIGVSSPNQGHASTCPFIALEYADGGTLAAHTGKPMSPRVAAEIVATLADAIQYAHGRGIVHRDLKPGNVLMRVHPQDSSDDAEGILGRMTPKVTDFGLAKRVDANGLPLQDGSTTVAGSMLGTPEYMAPEQAQGDAKIGPATDIYALGVILFELLTARVPLQGADALDTLVRVRSQEPPLPSRLQTKLPRDLDTICSRCLQKDPARRYVSAQALANDLRAWRAGRPIAARPIGALERLWKWSKRHPAVASLLVMVFLVSLTGFFGVFWQWQRAEARAASERQALQRASTALAAAETNLYFGRINAAQRELVLGNPWDAIRLLDANRPKVDRPDLRGWEWNYLNNVSHGELLSIQAADDWIWDVAFSRDGQWLITGSGSPFHETRATQPGGLKLWNANTGALIREYHGHHGSVLRVAISPDGNYLCSTSFDRTMRVWDVATAEQIWSQACRVDENCNPFNFGDAGPCSFTLDSQAVEYRGPDGQWRRLDIATGTVQPAPSLTNVALRSADHRFALMKHQLDDYEVIDTATEKSLGRIIYSPGAMREALSADGKRLLFARHEHLELFDVAERKRIRILGGDNSFIETLAASPDGRRFAAAGSGRNVLVWDQEFYVPTVYSGHGAEIRRLTFSADGQKLASCDRAGKVMVWDVNRNPRQQLVVVGTDCSAQWALGISADGDVVYTALPHAELCRHTTTGRPLGKVSLPGMTRRVEYPRSDISFSPDAQYVVGPLEDDNNAVGHWRTHTGELIRHYRGHRFPIMSTAWSRDGKRLATRASQRSKKEFATEVWVWDAESGEKICELTTEPVVSMALSSDGSKLLGATRTGDVRIWDVASRQVLWHSTAHRPKNYDGRSTVRIFGAAFAPDDQAVATVGFTDGAVQLWNAITGEKLHEPLPARPSLIGVTFTPDSRRVAAVGYDSEVRLWDVATGQLALTLSAPTGSRQGDTAYTARPYFSQRNQQLAVLDWSGNIVVWDGREKEKQETIPPPVNGQ